MSAEVQATHILYSAADVSCDHCRRAIEEAVSALDGVESVQVDVAAKTVDVRLNGAGADAASVRRAIEEAGYPVGDERILD